MSDERTAPVLTIRSGDLTQKKVIPAAPNLPRSSDINILVDGGDGRFVEPEELQRRGATGSVSEIAAKSPAEQAVDALQAAISFASLSKKPLILSSITHYEPQPEGVLVFKIGIKHEDNPTRKTAHLDVEISLEQANALVIRMIGLGLLNRHSLSQLLTRPVDIRTQTSEQVAQRRAYYLGPPPEAPRDFKEETRPRGELAINALLTAEQLVQPPVRPFQLGEIVPIFPGYSPNIGSDGQPFDLLDLKLKHPDDTKRRELPFSIKPWASFTSAFMAAGLLNQVTMDALRQYAGVK